MRLISEENRLKLTVITLVFLSIVCNAIAVFAAASPADKNNSRIKPPCKANFTVAVFSPGQGIIYSGTPVTFNNTSTGGATNFSWNFGDGTSSNSYNASHTYANAGTYIICLNISSADSSCSNTFCDTLNITANPSICNANFSTFAFSPGGGIIFSGTPITFTNTSTSSATNYSWNFGDGTSSNSYNASHTYANAGTYIVCLNISSATCSDVFCDTLNITANPSICNANFSTFAFSPGGGIIFSGTPITFTNTSTGSATNYLWNFGDGTSSNSYNASHTYTNAGTYIVCLNISSATCSDVFCDTLNITANPSICNANFSTFAFSPGGGIIFSGTPITFTNTSTGSATNYLWNFGDGTSSNSYNASHTYANAGTYIVCLNISSATCSDVFCDTLNITANPSICEAKFTYAAFTTSKGIIYTNMPINFNNASTGNVTNFSWDFGDGTGSSDMNPVHKYRTPGLYAVCLTASSANSVCSDIYCDSLLISKNPAYKKMEDVATRAKIMEVQIYPNPANNIVTITLGDYFSGKLSIVNLLGQEIFTEYVNDNKAIINTESFDKGIYFIRLNNEVFNDGAKLIVQH